MNHIPDTLASVRRVLVTRLRWLGDVVMSTPMLEALREALPQTSIEYLAYTPFAPALEGHPACDRVLALPPKAGPAATLSVVRELRRPRVDWCFDTLGNPRSAILIALAAPHHSVAPARGIRSYLYEYRQRHESGERSAVRHQLDMLIPLLGRVDMRPTSLFVARANVRRSRRGSAWRAAAIWYSSTPVPPGPKERGRSNVGPRSSRRCSKTLRASAFG